MKCSATIASSLLCCSLAGYGCVHGAQGSISTALGAVLAPALRQVGVTDFVEILPGVRISESIRTVEFDAEIAVDCHQPETPDVYLEVICCTPDTREHESLLVTSVPPSSIHAALLALGGEPGKPGGWRREGETIVAVPPEGDAVRVCFLVEEPDGKSRILMPEMLIAHHETGELLAASETMSSWRFAGSRIREFRGREVYDADGTGQLIGLHTFGSETIAWARVESPHAAIDEPQWLAANEYMPEIGTPVRVRIELLDLEPDAS